MRDTNKDWQLIAKEDPYWGVLSDERFRGKQLGQENRAEFFESGERYVADVLGLVNTHLGGVALDRALDFGCGVGRLAIPIAKRFREVVGADISEDMLGLTARHADESRQANVVPMRAHTSAS